MNLLNSSSILYAEDEGIIRLDVVQQLNKYFKTVIVAQDGEEALALYEKHQPDVLMLDINIPKINGLLVAKKIREHNTIIPIIMLTAYTETKLLLDAIDLQLTKYIVKPLSRTHLHETMLKIEKILKEKHTSSIILFKNYSWDKVKSILYKDKKVVILTHREQCLLALLIENHQKSISIEEIMARVWKDKYIEEISINVIKKLVSTLRKKLPNNALKSVYGSGYILNFYIE